MSIHRMAKINAKGMLRAFLIFLIDFFAFVYWALIIENYSLIHLKKVSWFYMLLMHVVFLHFYMLLFPHSLDFLL